MRLVPPLLVAALALTLPASGIATSSAATSSYPTVTAASERKAPALKVRKLVRNLDQPWDVRSIGEGRLLFTQRDRATLSVWKNGRTRKVKGFPSGRIWVSGETGLTGMTVDPDYEDNRRVYTCQGWRFGGGRHDIRVIAWRLDAKARNITRVKTLVKGFPTTSGRHGGCRLLVARDGSLLVGTGDAADGTNPRDLDSLGGKTLRLNRFTGRPWPTNKYADATTNRRYVHTYGHRNVQGLAQRQDGSLWSMEHGPYRDDEVNKLRNGGDYGWHPVPGYNESVPMTDHSLPGRQISARWRSGFPTVATSGGTFVYGNKWGAYDGALAVACLKASRVLFLTFDAKGKFVRKRVPRVLRQYGRLRQVVQAPNGSLLIVTGNGGGNDFILRVRPQ
jgi:aldose sugar dehydrogenase